jgi:hypothetical protein
MEFITFLDYFTSITGVIGTIIICFFPQRQIMRFTAFTLYVFANISLFLLACLKGIHITAGREIIYFVCSIVGMYKDWPFNSDKEV